MQYAGADRPGGLLTHVGMLVDGLVRSGHDLHVVLGPGGGADPTARSCESAGAEVSRLTVRGKTDLAGIGKLRSLVAAREVDVFHLHLSSPVEALPALLAARAGGAGHLVTTEHAPTWFPLRRFYSRAAKGAASAALDAVIALCRSDAEYLSTEFGVPRRLLRVIPNGVREPAARPGRGQARETLGWPADAFPVAGFVGELEAKKGIEDLLRAAESSGIPGLVLALAGEGALREGLSDRTAGLPFELIVPGRVDDVACFLSALDLFVFPSHQEAMPLALLEAMMAGLPIVATRIGGIPEALEHEVSGLLVAPGRPDELASAMRRLSGESGLAERLARAAREAAVATFSDGRMVAAVESLYREVAGR